MEKLAQILYLKKRITSALTDELAKIYNESGISSGDCTPEQWVKWQRNAEAMAELFNELIEQNRPR